MACSKELTFCKNSNRCNSRRYQDLFRLGCCLEKEACSLKKDLRELITSRKFYVSPELCREVNHIDNGINYLRLGSELLRKDRKIRIFTPEEKRRHESGSYEVLSNAKEKVKEIKKRMNVCKIADSLDLDVRQAYHDSVNDLLNVEKDMKDYVHSTVHRLNEYCANVGVTDRFDGYRNNMSWGTNDPVRCAQKNDTDDEKKCCCKNTAEPTCQLPVTNFCCDETIPKKTIQEQFGINMCFPGISEYTSSYKIHDNPPLLNYIINPTPDYNINGRCMASRVKLPMLTNYSENFVWPDECKLPLYPWIRK